MKRRVFYSFYHRLDAWRASQVRNIGVVEGNQPASDNNWEAVKAGGDAAIQRWIDRQLAARSCTVVLVGSRTSERRWIRYEIKKTWRARDMGLVGIRIHGLRNQVGYIARRGPNPFDRLVLKSGAPLSSRVILHDPSGNNSAERYARIRQNLADWIEQAIATR